MQEVLATVERVAPSNATVLLGGESGVGKDMIARAIHEHSRRAAGPFVKINCTAIPENLLESELFGYEKGAFTGAVASKPGKFELAHEGTIFLDEIGDVPGTTQVKLLRVLQEREFERLGGTKTHKVDVRVIAATNRNLRDALEEGTFREDLYYRLNVVPISIPPLREHKEDIPYLADLFITRFAKDSGKAITGITPAAQRLLSDFHWPGNVREVGNILLVLAQRRDGDGHHVQAVVEVFAKRALFERVAQIAVGGGDDAHVHLVRLGSPQALEFALLKNSQELHLGGPRHVADFVEEDGALVRQLKFPGLRGDGAGERPFFISEELALEKVFGDGRAIDFDERPGGAAGMFVDGAGNHVFADAAFAAQQHRGIGRRHALDCRQNFLHGGAPAHDVFELVALAERVAQAAVFLAQPARLQFL